METNLKIKHLRKAAYKLDALLFNLYSHRWGANARLQLLLENSKSIKEHNYVRKILRITSPTDMGSPFDSKKLI